METTLYLSQPIDNEKGYIDSLVSQIKAVKGALTLEITCVGGDTFQGERIFRAISEHKGKTKARVIGLAASMAGLLLAAFDEVEIDSYSDIMLHKAHIAGKEPEDVTAEEKKSIELWNQRAYERLAAKGVPEEVLEVIFLSETIKDYWLTAKQAEKIGLGYVTEVKRKNGKPSIMKMAASLLNHNQHIYNNYKMGLFGEKARPQIATLADGRQVVFEGKSDKIEVGQKLALIGSADSLQGKVKLGNKLVATIDAEQKVAAIEEETEMKAEVTAEVTDEAFAELTARLSELEAAVKMIVEKMGMVKEEGSAEPIAKVEEKVKAMEEETKEKVAAIDAQLGILINAVSKLGSNFTVPKMENKHEPHATTATSKEERVALLKQIANGQHKK